MLFPLVLNLSSQEGHSSKRVGGLQKIIYDDKCPFNAEIQGLFQPLLGHFNCNLCCK